MQSIYIHQLIPLETYISDGMYSLTLSKGENKHRKAYGGFYLSNYYAFNEFKLNIAIYNALIICHFVHREK